MKRLLCKSLGIQADDIIVLGSGPTSKSVIDQVAEYQKENDSLLISANWYDRPVDVGYYVFVDIKKYNEDIDSIPAESKVIVHSGIPVLPEHEDVYEMYKIKLRPPKKGKHIYASKAINIPDDGKFSYTSLGNAGFTSILISSFFCPKRILVVGFDGPGFDSEGNPEYVDKYDRPRHYFINKGRAIRKVEHFHKLLPFMKSKGIEIYAFAEDNLWNIDRSVLSGELA